MSINFKTSSHIAAILTHAARTIRAGNTLKSVREYMLCQLVTRVEAGQVEGADVGHCSGAFALQAVLRSKADFLAHCDREAAYWDDVAKEAIRAQRENRARAAAPRMFDLCHQAADAVIAHRPVKKWIWKSGDANGDVLGTIHDGQEHRARVDTTDSRDYFRCLDLDTGDFGSWFPTVADAVRDYFAPCLAEMFRDWTNNFLSVERFAEHYGLTVEKAHDVINRGRVHHEAEAQQTSASAQPVATPASTALTVICGTDTREWDDPVVMFIDAAAPEDVRAAVEAEYKRTLGEWAEDGGVILGIMRGHIQLGWSGYNGGNGLPDHTIADAFNNFGVKP